jgi:hypothetical protein
MHWSSVSRMQWQRYVPPSLALHQMSPLPAVPTAVCIGVMHPRREEVFRQLLSMDVNVLYGQGLWGPEFDAVLCAATVVFSPTLYTGRAFPSIMRIAVCASCGVPIVLEAPDDPSDDVSALVSRLGGVYLVPALDAIAPTVAMVRLPLNELGGSDAHAPLHQRGTGPITHMINSCCVCRLWGIPPCGGLTSSKWAGGIPSRMRCTAGTAQLLPCNKYSPCSPDHPSTLRPLKASWHCVSC